MRWREQRFGSLWEGRIKRKWFQVTRRSSVSSIRHARTGLGNTLRLVVAPSLPAIGFLPTADRSFGALRSPARLKPGVSKRPFAGLQRRSPHGVSTAGLMFPAYFFDSILECFPVRSVLRYPPHQREAGGEGQCSNPLPVPDPEHTTDHPASAPRQGFWSLSDRSARPALSR